MYNVHVNLNPFHPRNSAENAGAERAFFWSLAALLGSIHFLEEGGGEVGWRNHFEHECKSLWPSLYIFG